MKNPKIGERVRVYQGPNSYNGIIEKLYGDLLMDVRLSNGVLFHAHPKQCRRLVKKKARTWWATKSLDTRPVIQSSREYAQAMVLASDGELELIELREVRRKK